LGTGSIARALQREETLEEISRVAPLRRHVQCRFVASLSLYRPFQPPPSDFGVPPCRRGVLSLSGFRGVRARLNDTFYIELRAIGLRLFLDT
jgi:hypothetical protein